MANYANIKATIDANITQNGNEEITGPILNSVLKDMVDSLASGYLYAGVATTSGTPGTPDENVYYIATTPGTYTNYGGLVVNDTEVALLRYNGSWSKVVTGIPSQTIVNLASRGFYIDRNHAGSYSSSTFKYNTSSTNDVLWALIPEDADAVTVEGAVTGAEFQFSEAYPSNANFVKYMGTGNAYYGTVDHGNRLVLFNLAHADNSAGYGSLRLNWKGANLSIASRGGVYLDFWHVWSISSQVYTASSSYDTAWFKLSSGRGVISVTGATPAYLNYFSSRIPSSSTHIASYSVTTYPETAFKVPEGAVLCLVTFDKSANPGGYDNLAVYQNEDYAIRRKVRILAVGNSYDLDAWGYVPFIMPSIEPGLEVEIGCLYHSGATLEQHWNWWDADTDAYEFYWCSSKDSAWTDVGEMSLRDGLVYQDWDIITWHTYGVGSWDYTTHQPYLNDLINGVYSYLSKPVRFGWYLTQSKPLSYTDAQVENHWSGMVTTAQSVLNYTLCDILFPVGTAIQNARHTSLKSLGDYGNLTYEGNHLQEGLPCQLAAYSNCLTLLRVCGYSDRSIYGDKNRATSTWLSGKSIPGPNGSPVGATDENCRLAQMCAMMADKFPYQLSDFTGM